MEIKKEIFKRLPPGDRWVEIGKENERVHTSLTEALEHYYQQAGVRQYYIDAVGGYIYKVDTVEDPKPVVRQFSIYGDQ
jgi:hypothetical protein